MGTIADIRCSRCDYHQSFPIGSGMRDYELSVIRDCLIAEDADQLDLFLSLGITGIAISRKLGQCQVCHQLQIIPKVSVDTVDGKHTKLINHCQTCGSPQLRELTLEGVEQLVSCPVCGEKLQGRESGRWD